MDEDVKGRTNRLLASEHKLNKVSIGEFFVSVVRTGFFLSFIILKSSVSPNPMEDSPSYQQQQLMFDPNHPIKQEEGGEEYLAAATASGQQQQLLSGRGGSKGGGGSGRFWPERPKADPALVAAGVKANTVLTNLQRGNIPTMQTVVPEPTVATTHQKAGQGEIKAAELLNPATVNEPDGRRRTPLFWAAFYGQTPTVNRLLAHGADVAWRDEEDCTALHYAANSGHTDIVKILLGAGADRNAEDENAVTPLMLAATNNHPHVVHELLTR